MEKTSTEITMDTAYFEDSNGRKAKAFLAVVATESVLQEVEKKNSSEKVRNAVEVIRSLPTASQDELSYSEKDYARILRRSVNSGLSDSVYVVTLADRLEANMPTGDNLSFSRAQKGMWDSTVVQAIATVARQHPQMQSRNADFKKMSAQNLTLQAFSPLDAFAQNDAFAVFCRMKFHGNIREGYVVDKNGALGPLSRALLFESMAAVEQAVKRWRNTFQTLPQVQVVNLKMQVASLGPVLPTLGAGGYYAANLDLDHSVIHEIGAQLQRKAIEQALDTASVEQIEQALERKSQLQRKM